MSVRIAVACVLLTAACAPQQLDAQQASVEAAGKEWAQRCADWDEWDKPAPPFQIYGNAWYVGTCGISAILIAGDDGHVLIDGGPANAANVIAANIEALGFKLSDVKLLLHSHEHHDHVGGLAELQRLTGARLLASSAAAAALTSGTAGADDPQFEDHGNFPATRVDVTIQDSEPVRLGHLTLTPIATPGHTPGALSWQWQACARGGCHTVVYADSLTPVSSDGYRFGDHPETVAAFRASLARVGALGCSILLTPHPSASGMRDRLLEGDLTDTNACRDYAESLAKRLDERLAKETDG